MRALRLVGGCGGRFLNLTSKSEYFQRKHLDICTKTAFLAKSLPTRRVLNPPDPELAAVECHAIYVLNTEPTPTAQGERESDCVLAARRKPRIYQAELATYTNIRTLRDSRPQKQHAQAPLA